MEAKLSIIIPAYNVAGYLEKCLDSILVQTFEEFEVILVDDGSTDSTPDICDGYAKKDGRIHVIHKPNEGVSAARNTGIEIAVGEYFLFFDGDDFVEPYTCEELYQLAKDKQVDTILYGYHRYEDGRVKETCYPIFPSGIYEEERILKELLPRFIGIAGDKINSWLHQEENALYVENPALWRAMVSARTIKEYQILFDRNLKVGEDTIFISEYLSYAKRCYVQPKCYYYLVTRNTSTIYVYEQNPLAKLEGKLKLLAARKELTQRIQSRRKTDISKSWNGTVVMSVIEIAFLLAKKHPKLGFRQRFGMFLQYSKHSEVRKIVREFQLKPVIAVKVVPFILLKLNLNLFLFLCAVGLQMIHYEFQRR